MHKLKHLSILLLMILIAPGLGWADQKKSGNSGSKDTPKESVGLNYGQVKWTYTSQKGSQNGNGKGANAPAHSSTGSHNR
jgi:hypothetical protein